MHRSWSKPWVLAATALLATFVATAAPPPQIETPRSPAVKLWLDTASGNPCEQAQPASGEWTLQNKEDRTVRVTIHRVLVRDGATHEDVMKDTLEPGERREMDCEVSDDGRASLTLIKAVY